MSAIKKHNKRIITMLVLALCSIISSFSLSAAPLSYNYDTVLPLAREFDPQAQFRTDLYTGAATYTYGIKVAPGTNDVQPELSAFYNHHLRTTKPGIVGTGWLLSENYIQRDTNSTRNDDSDDEFDLVLNGVTYELVNNTNEDRFHTKIESFLHIEFVAGGANNTNGTYWVVKTKDGTEYQFGFFASSELIATENNLVWRWSLDSITDTYGNVISYAYKENPFGDTGKVYLHNISYNNDKKRSIDFGYESTQRPDVMTVYNNGNKIKELRRLEEINISADGKLVRQYTLQYAYDSESTPAFSFLSDITEFGDDGIQSLPPVEFEYYPAIDSWTPDSSFDVPECDNDEHKGCFATSGGADNGVRLADLNRDGLVDIVRANEETGSIGSKVWINTGNGWDDTVMTYPSDECSSNNIFLCFARLGEDRGTMLADANGDGFVDIVKASAQHGESRVYINDGSTWNYPSGFSYTPGCSSSNPNMCFVTSSGADNGVRLVEVNGDNLPDLVKAEYLSGTSVSTNIWINTGRGWEDNPNFAYPECESGIGQNRHLCFVDENNNDNGVRLTDVNGDGLADIVKAEFEGSNAVSQVWLNTGKGWEFVGGVFPYPECETGGNKHLCFIENGADNGVRLLDVNGDGLPEIVKAKDGVGQVWINTGNGWQFTGGVFTYPKCESGNKKLCVIDGGDNGVRLADINGDALPDILKAEGTSASSGETEVQVNDAAKSSLLQNITYSLGGETSIDYEVSTALNNSGNDSLNDLGFVVWLVDHQSDYNGMSNAHKVNATTVFNYSGGLFDYEDEDFRGFHNVIEIKANKTFINHSFHQDDGRKGKEFRTEIVDNNDASLYQRKAFNWNTTVNNSYFITLLFQENTSTFDGLAISPKVRNISYAYDSFGNVLMQFDQGDVASSSDDRYEYFNFIYNTTAWIVAAPSQYLLYDATNTTKLRETKYSYDGRAFGSIPIRGDITQEEEVLTGGTSPVTTFSYDTHGNLVNTTDTNNQVTTFVYGLRETTFTFPDQEINAKGHVTNKWFDLGTGNVLAEVDPNGFTANFTYDAFGRISKEIQPLDTETYPTRNYTYFFDGTAPEVTRVRQREQNETSNTFDTYTSQDGLRNTIQVKTDGENSHQVVEDTYYDDLLRVQATSNKYFSPTTSDYTAPNASVKRTQFMYDVLDRTTQITNPDDTVKQFTHKHWVETQFDENNNYKVIKRDAYRQTAAVIEANGEENYTTTYNYTAANELTNITDNEGNEFTFVYDTLGRRVLLVDPDLGTQAYTYDGVDNLLTTTDDRGITTTFTYDELNRITKKSTTTEAMNYFYDVNTLGTLSSVASDVFVRNYTYDERLRVVQEVKNSSGTTYTLKFVYDSFDRKNRTILGTQENITYEYTEQGVTNKIEGIINGITHNEISAVLDRTYENSEVTTQSYQHNNFRLKQVVTGSKQNLAYTYNNVTDIIALNDSVYNRSYTMEYDALSRLIDAERIDDGSTTVFDFNYTYNSIGNILNITSSIENMTYFYNGSLAHVPSKVIQVFPEQVINITSFTNLSASGSVFIFETIAQNTGSANLTHVNWTLQTGTEDINSTIGINLTVGESVFILVEHDLVSSGEHTITSVVEGGGQQDTAVLTVLVP